MRVRDHDNFALVIWHLKSQEEKWGIKKEKDSH
jgi:hypothetical protein